MNDKPTENKTAEAPAKEKTVKIEVEMVQSKDVSRRVCLAFMARAEHQEIKGKFRDKAALEFVLGAMAAVDPDSLSFKRLGLLAMLCSVRGYSIIKEWAKE